MPSRRDVMDSDNHPEDHQDHFPFTIFHRLLVSWKDRFTNVNCLQHATPRRYRGLLQHEPSKRISRIETQEMTQIFRQKYAVVPSNFVRPNDVDIRAAQAHGETSSEGKFGSGILGETRGEKKRPYTLLRAMVHHVHKPRPGF